MVVAERKTQTVHTPTSEWRSQPPSPNAVNKNYFYHNTFAITNTSSSSSSKHACNDYMVDTRF